jgi:hypothetical protein
LLVYGQPSSDKAGSNNNGDLKKQTSGGALSIVIQPSPQPIGHTGPTSLKLRFLTKGTNTMHLSIFKFAIYFFGYNWTVELAGYVALHRLDMQKF